MSGIVDGVRVTFEAMDLSDTAAMIVNYQKITCKLMFCVLKLRMIMFRFMHVSQLIESFKSCRNDRSL